jgi:hypothetical protein
MLSLPQRIVVATMQIITKTMIAKIRPAASDIIAQISPRNFKATIIAIGMPMMMPTNQSSATILVSLDASPCVNTY